MKPPIPDTRRRTIGWAQTFCEDWEECKNDPDYAPIKAWSLLAAWGAVCRFYAAPPAELASLPQVLKRDAMMLLDAMQQAPQPLEWIVRARSLDTAWDGAVDDDALHELDAAAADLFDELDRHSLAVCVARRLATHGSADSLAAWQEQLDQAEDFFRDHIEGFLPAIPLVRAGITCFRSGLEEDADLWETALKYYLLGETADELALVPHGDPTKASLRVPASSLLGFSKSTKVAYPVFPSIAAGGAANGSHDFECRDPQSRYIACFVWSHPDQQPVVVVTFYRNELHAVDLRGTVVRLRGVPAEIDDAGRARFPRRDLENQTGPLRMEVGEPSVAWTFTIESNDELYQPLAPTD